MRGKWGCVGLVLVLSGCPSADISGGEDAAATDASADAGLLDGGEGDAGPNDAGPANDAGASDAGPTFTTNVMFVTSTLVMPGTLGGLSGADDVCNERARIGGLPEVGSYVAWLSTPTTNAISRISGSRGWVRPDGVPFADRPSDLTDGRILGPPSLDERGEPAAGVVITASNAGGQLHVGLGGTGDGSCEGWASTSGDVWIGSSIGGTRTWTSAGDQECSRAGRIYCFGTGRITPIEVPAPIGRLAFLSRASFTGDQGRDTFDSTCEAEASDAGFPGRRFVALVSSATEAATERLSEGSPWVRPDGIVVAETIADLTSQLLLAPVSPSADLSEYDDSAIWVGATTPDARSRTGQDCRGWSTLSGTGSRGYNNSTRGFFDRDNVSCSTPNPVLCFEP